MIIKAGQEIRKQEELGYYSDEISCLTNSNHRVLWWNGGAFCLDENKCVDVTIKTSNYRSGAKIAETGSEDYKRGYNSGYIAGIRMRRKKNERK